MSTDGKYSCFIAIREGDFHHSGMIRLTFNRSAIELYFIRMIRIHTYNHTTLMRQCRIVKRNLGAILRIICIKMILGNPYFKAG